MEKLGQTILESTRRAINRRFPLRIVRKYAREYRSVEEMFIPYYSREDVQRMSAGERERVARSCALQGREVPTAYFLQEAGVRRSVQREVMKRSLTVYGQQVASEIQDYLQRIATRKTTLVDVEDMLSALDTYFRIHNDWRALALRRTRLSTFLEHIL